MCRWTGSEGPLANRDDDLAVCNTSKREGSKEFDWRPKSTTFGFGCPDSTWQATAAATAALCKGPHDVRSSGYMCSEYTTYTRAQIGGRARRVCELCFVSACLGYEAVLNNEILGCTGAAGSVLQRTTSRTKS
jgi:hypothetical protein